jgi:hypothetical protein
MAGVPQQRVRELWAALRPAAPGVAVAVVALVLAATSILVGLFRHPLAMVGALLGLVLLAPLATMAVWGAGLVRRIAVPAAILVAAPAATLLLLRRQPVVLVLVGVLLAVAVRAAGHALRAAGRRPPPALATGTPVARAVRPVLLVNPRNHFARDLGLDPADPVGALDAYGDAEERSIDVGVVGERVFVNNVSLGVYARLVGTEGYRERKAEAAWQVLPATFAPGAQPFDLRFTGPDGQEHAGFHLILVSNGPYGLTADRRFGSRGRMDLGVLGIVAARAGEGDAFPRFAEAWWAGRPDPSRGWLQWEAREFEVRSGGPMPAGVDGEAVVMDAPVRFRCLPGALRVRLPGGTRGSPQGAAGRGRRSPWRPASR